MSKTSVQPQDKYVLRMPDGMRDRIKAAAERNGRSMNAEIVQALEQTFPEQPSVEEVMGRIHDVIEMSEYATWMPYRALLIEALDNFAERVASGLEADQFQSRAMVEDTKSTLDLIERNKRWKRARDHGVELSDLQRELDKGMLDYASFDQARRAINLFDDGRPEAAMDLFLLAHIKFAEPDASHLAIKNHLQKMMKEKWGGEEFVRDLDDDIPF